MEFRKTQLSSLKFVAKVVLNALDITVNGYITLNIFTLDTQLENEGVCIMKDAMF